MKKIIVAVLSLFIFTTGCDTDELHDLNINPQALNTVDMNFLFTAAQLGTASGGSRGDNRYIDWRTNMGMFGHAIQQLANVSGGIAPGDKYTQDNGETNAAPWDFLYNDVLQNTAEILKQTGEGGFEEGQKSNMRQATRIMRAYNFMRLTDYYGNIPYTEALQGLDGIFFPVYTPQATVYADLLKEVSEATSALNTGGADEGFSGADLMFEGDISKWKKFGNTLLLRMALRVSNVDAGMASQYASTAISRGLMTSNADMAMIPMALGPSEWTNQNGISRAFADGDGGQPSALSKTLVDWLIANDDPRLMILSGGVDGDMDPAIQRGLPNGLDTGDLEELLGEAGLNPMNEFSVINPLLLDDDEDYVFMNYSEAEFLLAEAAERGIGGASGAEAHYNAGVMAAVQQYAHYDASFAVSDADAAAYVAGVPYEGLQSIGNQMWASKFFNWWDAWSDWRRTGYPDLTPINYLNNLTGGTIPRKLKIPSGEIASNGDNYLGGATLPNEYTTRVWWDGGQ